MECGVLGQPGGHKDGERVERGLVRTLRSAAPAGIAAALMYLVTSSGSVSVGPWLPVQLGALAGATAGLVATSYLAAVGAAVLGCGLAAVLFPPAAPLDAAGSAYLLLAAAALAAGAFALGRVRFGRKLGAAIVVIALAVNAWVVVGSVVRLPMASRQGRSIVQELSARPATGQRILDSELYRDVSWNIHDGMPFYSAYSKAWRDIYTNVHPHSLFDLRQPALFEFWAHLPGWPLSALWAFLVLMVAAMCAAPFVSSRAVPFALGALSSAMIGGYLMSFIFTQGSLYLFEQWTGAVAVFSMAAFALAQSKHHRVWMAVAAATAVLAFVSRELMVFLLVAGLASAFFGPERHRRYDIAVWGCAIAAAAVAYGLHASRAVALISAAPQLGQAWVGKGGFEYLALAVEDFTKFVSPHVGVVWLLVLLGVVGALAQPDRQFRVFAGAAVLLPLVAFLFVGNVAVAVNGHRMNYWGAVVLPTVFAFVPSAFVLLRGKRRGAVDKVRQPVMQPSGGGKASHGKSRRRAARA
jgi:hypothetical protein